MAEARPKRAVVTGASSGLGAEFARQLAARKVDVVLVARRRERLEALADELRADHGVRADVVAVDLATPDSPHRLFLEATREGRTVDLLVNNAGFGLYQDFVEESWERTQRMLFLNIMALVELSHRFALHMLESGAPGWILNVGSVGAYQPVPGFAAYAASKAFVRDFTEALNHELRGTPIAATVVNPGPTRTEFMDVAGMGGTSGLRERIAFMDADEVARIGLEALFRGKPNVVTGWLNKITTFVTRFGSRRTNAKLAARFMDLGA